MFSSAQVTFNTLVNFDGPNGYFPSSVLTQGADGNFYGTTQWGGTNNCELGCGTIFKMTSTGTLTTLHNFCSQLNCADGSAPMAPLMQVPTGDFYGTTSSNGVGTVFKMTSTGTLTTLYTFCALADCADGAYPSGALTLAGGNLYGTTRYGAQNPECNVGTVSCGTIFKINSSGILTTLYNFCALDGCPDGYTPMGGLISSANGNLYGVTAFGGNINYLCQSTCGTVFEINPAGKLTTLHSFDITDGYQPTSGLIQGKSGDFYGETFQGGSGGCGLSGFSVGCGTIFKITAKGALTTLYNFLGGSDGGYPQGPLVQGTDGNFYGTTQVGGTWNAGTVFEITPEGVLTTLYAFCGGVCGWYPEAGLFQATDGNFYGTTTGGGSGTQRDGTVFSLATGLSPFVKTEPKSAREGATVGIFGQGFTDSSIVQFDGVQSTKIKPYGTTFLTATVPAAALTGSVTVTTGATTLTSNQPFLVKPQVISFDPPSGSVGTQVTITGSGFMQTNGVGFGDNVPAEFTVNSDTQITATVPAGAKTGPVGVVTKGGTGISTATFTMN
jgi:uncharacterized repeat protein (TIGR03803 family)